MKKNMYMPKTELDFSSVVFKSVKESRDRKV